MSELYSVLVVDDELLVRQGIKYILNWEQHGFQIVGEASNGKEALNLIEKLQPQIVLTDIVMPVMDGEELTRLIKTSWPDIEVIVLSSFSEFDYVRSSFQSGVSDYILKPQLETGALLDVLHKTVSRLPSRCRKGTKKGESSETINLVLEKLLSDYEVELDSRLVAAWLPHPCFYLLGTPSCLQAEAETDYVRTESSVLGKLKAFFCEMVAFELPGAEVPGYPDMAVYLLNVKEEDHEMIPEKLKMLYPGSISETGEVIWVLSRGFDQLDQLRAAYRDSLLKLLEYRFFLPVDIVLIHSELPKIQKQAGSFPLNSFMELVRRLQLEQAFEELRQYVRSQELDYTADVFEFKSLISNIIFNLIHLLGSMHYEVKKLDEAKYAYFKIIDQARHLEELVRLLDEFQRLTQQCVYAMGDGSGGNPSMKLLLDYIEEHYAEPVTLTEMAKHFHFNPSYLSSFFAAHHHEGFKEHLNRVRIHKAADLLRYGDTAISEIGCRVGYGDHSYFCKVFKRNTGMSPSQYRRHYFQAQGTRET